MKGPYDAYRAHLASGALEPDRGQERAARALQALHDALRAYRPRRFVLFGAHREPPRGIYLHGDVGRGKSMLMDMFFAAAPLARKRRVHFNRFMTETHARIHEWRGMTATERARAREFVRDAGDDPIPPAARAIAREARLLCFDEFQVSDVADAMILGRLFRELFALGVVVVATSNTPPGRLYQGGLNRQLFLPFIDLMLRHMDVLELAGPTDFRLGKLTGLRTYLTPLGHETDAAIDSLWARLCDGTPDAPLRLEVQGRAFAVPRAANGAARLSFEALCAEARAAADYLALARRFDALVIERVPRMGPEMRNEARRFTLLIDTLYDEGTALVCSAAAEPHALYPQGDGADAFRRTASRLVEMQGDEYRARAGRAAV